MTKLAGLDSNQFEQKYISAAIDKSESHLTASYSAQKRRLSSRKTFRA